MMTSKHRTEFLLALCALSPMACNGNAKPGPHPVTEPVTLASAEPTDKPAPPPKPAPEAVSRPLPSLVLKSNDKKVIEPELQKWVDSLKPPLKLTVSSGVLAFNDNSKSHRLEHQGWKLFMGFDGPTAGSADAKALQEKFKYFGIDALPLPIEVPDWDLQLVMPTSSVREGVEVLTFAEGKLNARITSEFFQLHGRKTTGGECNPPADGSMPAPCFVSIRRKLPFELTVVVELRD